jgi:hypothetical protein
MSLIYVTGLSGTGKSAILGELRARGYRARGVDEDGYADWINRVTGTADEFPYGTGILTFMRARWHTSGGSAPSGSAC